MKKFILTMVALIGLGISANAGQHTSSCAIYGISGAYVNAEARISSSGGGIDIKIIANGVTSGTVICEVRYKISGVEKKGETMITFSFNPRTGQVEGSGYINAPGRLSNDSDIIETRVYNAQCTQK